MNLVDLRNVDPKMIHLIGHSLGCHVAGIAAKAVFQDTGSKIGRISALDPASPQYSDLTDDGKYFFINIIFSYITMVRTKNPRYQIKYFEKNKSFEN